MWGEFFPKGISCVQRYLAWQFQLFLNLFVQGILLGHKFTSRQFSIYFWCSMIVNGWVLPKGNWTSIWGTIRVESFWSTRLCTFSLLILLKSRAHLILIDWKHRRIKWLVLASTWLNESIWLFFDARLSLFCMTRRHLLILKGYSCCSLCYIGCGTIKLDSG